MDYDGLSVNLWANLRWIPIIVYFKVSNSLKKEPFKNTLDTEEYEGFHIIRFSTHCKDANKYAHTDIIITSTWEWKRSFTDEQLFFFFLESILSEIYITKDMQPYITGQGITVKYQPITQALCQNQNRILVRLSLANLIFLFFLQIKRSYKL